jgi:hypothetical protein
VVYGVFIALGELGPGDNIGLIASKTCSTAIRGRYYGIAAAVGKIGAFVGTKVLGILISSALCILSACLALFLLPDIGQDTIDKEDAKFRLYLEENGYDVSKMGVGESTEHVVTPDAKEL